MAGAKHWIIYGVRGTCPGNHIVTDGQLREIWKKTNGHCHSAEGRLSRVSGEFPGGTKTTS
jgi:hypothetical protein